MNLSQLDDFLKNIIKAVNQHAKLLQTLNSEMQLRVTERQMGEVLQVISDGLPYQRLLTYVPTLIEDVQLDESIESESSVKQEKVLVAGTEMFVKSTEIIGHYLLDLKDYSLKNDQTVARIDSGIQ